ncbi:MAG: DUF4382 domain-containing protein [Bacteroidetes bacterium]|nr:DUF4382 domain-containing protein [Bacteroidota bacterium]
MKSKLILVSAVVATAVLFASCKKNESITGQSDPNSSANAMRVKMTDAPADYAGMKVTITSVEAYLDHKGWITLNNQSQVVSVLDLTNGKTIDLSYNGNVEIGTYSKIKLRFGDSNTLDIDGAVSAGGVNANGTFNLKWYGEKEIEIPINATVGASGEAVVLLDFDAASSIKESLGEYIIKPVVREVKDESTGVKGNIETGAKALVEVTGPSGTISSFADINGNFELKGLDAGSYTVKVMKASRTILNAAQSSYTISGVVVAKGEVKSMGTIKF